MVPGGFSWFFHGSRLVFHSSRSVFMVIHGSALVFHGFRSFFMVFRVPGWFFMVPGDYLWFSWYQVSSQWFKALF